MKTFTFRSLMSVFAIGLMAGFVSCEKSEVEPAEVSEAKSADSQTLSRAANGVEKDLSLRYLYTRIDCDPGLLGEPCIVYPLFCGWPSGNCLPTIVIHGAAGTSDLNKLLGHIENDTYDEYFSGPDFARTFGNIRNYPRMHALLKNKELSFTVEKSDTLDQYLYLIGFNAKVDSTERTQNDILLTFEIDQN